MPETRHIRIIDETKPHTLCGAGTSTADMAFRAAVAAARRDELNDAGGVVVCDSCKHCIEAVVRRVRRA